MLVENTHNGIPPSAIDFTKTKIKNILHGFPSSTLALDLYGKKFEVRSGSCFF